MSDGWITVQEDWCKACGLCLEACKLRLIKFDERLNLQGYHPVVLSEPENCTGCAVCAQVCPEVAIEVFRKHKTASKPRK